MEKTKKLEKLNDFVVIGINRLGESVATHLYALGKEVLAIDKNQVKINSLGGKVSTAVSTDAASYEVLHSLGVQNFDCAIICINDNLEGSLVIAQIVKDLGVKYVIAAAISDQHGKILTALGVDLVIYPDEFVGNKLASMLSNPGINELVDLTDDFKIFEMCVPEVWKDKAIIDLNLRKKYKLSIVFIKRGNKVILPEPETILLEGDTLVMAGENSKIKAVASLHNDPNDIESQLSSVFGEK